MKRYMVTLHGNPFYGLTYSHTKAGVSYYADYITTSKEGLFEELVSFSSEREAKLWLISRSSMQNTKHFMFALAGVPDTKLDEIIAKGKYRLSKAIMKRCDIDPSNHDTKLVHSRADYPLLCEFVITEYDENVLQQEQGNSVDSSKSSNK